jgi:two-component system, sensor histidine kinase and response regulator
VPSDQNNIAPAAQHDPADQIFNPDSLMQVGTDNDAYRMRMLVLIRNVVMQSPSQFIEARQAWEARNPDDAVRILHAMRSSLGMLGAKQFSAASLAIEKAMRERALDSVPSLFELARNSLDRTMTEANLWLERQAPEEL